MAKDGSNRGGPRSGVGAKKKPLADKLAEGNLGKRPLTVIEFPGGPDLHGIDMPKPNVMLSSVQKDGKTLQAEDIYRVTWDWLKERGCAHLVSPQVIERYAMSAARWIQCEEAVTEYGFLAKHPKKCEFCGRFFIPRRNTRQYCSPACASKQRNLDGFCGETEVSAAYKRIVANLTAKDKKQKELRRQYCLDGGAVVKPREVLRQFYDENYTQQEHFRSAWETLNKAEEKSWADRQAYEQAKADYLSWLDSRLSYAKRIHIDQDSYLEEF